MKITFDVATRTLDLDIEGMSPTGGQFSACLNRHGQRVPLNALKFGLIVESNGVEIARFDYPRDGQKYVRTDQDTLLTEAVSWVPDDNLILTAYMSSALGPVERQWYLTAPRPAQPYPSWTWDGGRWVAPVPYPDEGGEYEWNEATQAWEIDHVEST